MNNADARMPTDLDTARSHLALALDVDSLEEALSLAERLHPWFSVAKVGLELYATAGSDAIRALLELDFEVFVDLKLHDIPTTVARASRVLGALGARYVTVHTSGGVEMCRAAVEGLAEGSASKGFAPAVAVGVTVLTSDAVADESILHLRAAVALEAGCGAYVCAAPDLPIVRSAAPGLLSVVPGTRPAGYPADDQARVLSAPEAIDLGADLLVIGRPVTRALDPDAAAAALAASVAARIHP